MSKKQIGYRKQSKHISHIFVNSDRGYDAGTYLIQNQSQVYEGKHPALITREIFDRAQDILHGRLHSRQRSHFYSARGFLICGACGCIITAETQKGFSYYHCTNGKGICGQKKNFMRSEFIDNMLSNIFQELKIEPELIELSFEAYKAQNQAKLTYTATSTVNLKNELSGLPAKESMLTDSYTSQVLRKDLLRGENARDCQSPC